MDAIDRKEAMLGIVMIVAGLAYLYLAMDVPKRGIDVVDSAFVPTVLAVTMCVLGACQLLTSRKTSDRGAAPGESDQASDAERPGYVTVVKTLLLIVGYTALLDKVGFPIMTAIYLFLQFIVLTPARTRVNLPLYGLIAVVASVVIFATFRYAFELLLPAGVLADFLG